MDFLLLTFVLCILPITLTLIHQTNSVKWRVHFMNKFSVIVSIVMLIPVL
jgi:hypothetical protein